MTTLSVRIEQFYLRGARALLYSTTNPTGFATFIQCSYVRVERIAAVNCAF